MTNTKPIYKQCINYIKDENYKRLAILLDKNEQLITDFLDSDIGYNDAYVEIAKICLPTDKLKTIKYLEKYKNNKGKNEEVLLFLAKLYRQTQNIDKARKIIKRIKLNNSEYFSEVLLLSIAENNARMVFNSVKDIIKNNFDITNIKELANFYITAKAYKKLEHILNTRQFDNSLINKHYYLYKCYKGLKKNAQMAEQLLYMLEKSSYENIYELHDEAISSLQTEWYYSNKQNLLNIVKILCILIEYDDTDNDVIKNLSLILRKNMFSVSTKKLLINELMQRYKDSKKPRAANIFLNEAEILSKKAVLKSKPRQLIAELTTNCNLSCVMCSLYANKYNINNNLLKFIKDSIPCLERIKWQGGEVFLYPKFKELVKMAARYGVRQVIQTNGLLLNEETLDLLMSVKELFLSFSIDSPDKQTYEKIRRGAKFEELLAVLERVKLYKRSVNDLHYTVIMVVTSLNYKQLDDMISFAIKHGFNGLTFQKFIPNDNPSLLLNKEQKQYVVEKIKYFRKQHIPLEIRTSIPLNGQYENLEETALPKQALKNRPITIKGNGKIKITENIQNRNSDQKILHTNSKLNLFCAAPWTELCLSACGSILFGAGSISIDVSGCSYDKIWNCDGMTEYREKLICNDLSYCTIACRQREDDSNRIRLGLVKEEA
jgi:MoaA/NifB/PqqE/SkfB family radical SAM enzyme